jgi:hypothetical protein
MWAQLITTRLKPGKDMAEAQNQLRAAEQPGSGLVRTLVVQDQKDPSQVYTLVVFESEEKARARAGSAPPGKAASRPGGDGRYLRRPAAVHRPEGRPGVDGLSRRPWVAPASAPPHGAVVRHSIE